MKLDGRNYKVQPCFNKICEKNKKQKKLKKLMPQSDRAAASKQLVVACRAHAGPIFFLVPPLFSSFFPHFWALLANSSSLAPAHARPTQTSPKNFKHP
jgi:hypothetical protein